MKVNFSCKNKHSMGDRKHSNGPSSFFMQNPEIIFKELDIKKGNVFLDIGCGAGDYSFYASKFVGESGIVYAIDRSEEIIKNINSKKIKNIKTKITDITEYLPFEDKSIDICLLSTVLHAIPSNVQKNKIFFEINRILKDSGYLAIIECKKEEMHFGPPMNMRISAKELESMLNKYGFEQVSLIDLGYNYMIKFSAR
ncbi:MAG: class I SAM-dependent methyltransferase [Fusobacteriaceae bacterium]|nr:class I SAM-dependent methyltransferase [Fusobacteriaceae bacterium]